MMNLQGRRAARGTILAAVVVGVACDSAESRPLIDGGALAIQSRTPIDVASLGPQVGERVPEFSLPDQHGETRTLESVLGPNGALLLFHRSADW
jgi:hypothetical protein